jgi:hypothetical protein
MPPYEWEEWALAGLKDIEPDEVCQVLGSGARWPRPALGTGGTPVLTLWGRTDGGRPLIVAVYHVDGVTWKVIGARDMTGPERAQFARWEATGDE